MKKLLKDIRDNNILLEVVDGKLKVFTNEPVLNQELIASIRERKEELIQFLQNNDQAALTDSFKLDIPAAQEAPSYPLSSAQRRLWLLSQTTAASSAYNMHNVYVLEGKLENEAFDHAFKTLLQRHESLRTVFREDAQREVKQVILMPEEIGFKILSFDLRNEKDQEEKISYLLQEDAVMPFDLVAGPLVRASLLQVEDSKWIFSYAMHHIISDGWSVGVLINELLLSYKAYTERLLNPLSPLRIQYKDYAAWQHEQLKNGELIKQKEYWLQQFKGALPVLELTGDMVRPGVKTYNGGMIRRKISADLTRSIKALSKAQGGTLFIGLLAAVKALLYKYTNQEDIIIGSPIAGREHVDLEGQIGFYVNMLALRTQFNASGSFRELLENVKRVTLDAYEHQGYPFDELVAEANLTRDLSRHPLFDVAVALQNADMGQFINGGEMIGEISVSPYTGIERVVSIFDLRFDFKEAGNELLLKIDYNNDIYNRETVEHLADHFEQLLSSIVDNPDTAVNRLDYLTDEDRHSLTKILNGPAVDYPRDATIISLFEGQVSRTPDNIAIVHEEEEITYRQLNERANQVAHFLINEIGLQMEDSVGMLLDRKPDCIAVMLGILKAGGMYVPIETDTPEDRLRFMIADTGMKVLITEKAFIETANRVQWADKCLESYLCVDTTDVYSEKERGENLMMSQELWDHVGARAVDQITGGGWISSYTGVAIPAEEMEEYAMNAYKKLAGSLHKQMRVLEIGCSSGLTMSKIAPEVAFYYGTDLSPVILENTRVMLSNSGISNIKLKNITAHEIAALDERDFDLIIINSVIQHFHGHNYLRSVIADAIGLLSTTGKIFIGDVMDIEAKDDLIKDLEAFKAANAGKGYNTKTDFSADLFVAKGFFQDLALVCKEIAGVHIDRKIYTIENELTKFRYDVVLDINKEKPLTAGGKPNKRQFSNKVLMEQPLHNPSLNVDAAGLAYLIYTSGTTGRPKGVMVQHYNVVRLLHNDAQLFNFSQTDIWTMFHSYCFDFSVWEMYGALLFGGKLVIVPKATAQDTAKFLQLLLREKVTILNQTPSAFYNLIKEALEHGDADLQLRYVIFGGEALSPIRLKEWKERYPLARLINMYGITETTVHVTYKEVTDQEIAYNISNIGKPIPTLSCYVLDHLQQPVAVGVPGELYVGGDGVARGYLNRPELTDQRFIANPFGDSPRLYRSGDKVRILQNGELEYIGRVDDQVKIRGYRIELGEIKNALDNHSLISESVVVTRQDMNGDKSLVAYVVCKEKLNATELRAYLHEKLPDYMVPSYYVELPAMPLTVNGKVDRKALPSPEGLAMATGAQYIAPRTGLELSLVAIFSDVLGISKDGISVSDNFFALGGDSIKAMRLVVQIKKILSLGITIGKLYEHQTIEELAAWLADSNGEETVYNELRKGLAQIDAVRQLIEEENKQERKLPEGYEDIYPVSKVEQGMIYSSMFNPAEPVYYDQFVFFVEVDDFDLFRAGIARMVNRHPILRTRYYVRTFSQPVKVVLDRTELPISYEDLSTLSEDKRNERINAFLQYDRSLRLSFDDELLWKFKIFQMQAGSYCIIWSFHHAALDGWSISVFCRELSDLLSKEKRGVLPALKYNYKDYCAVVLGKERSEKVDNFWRSMLNGHTKNKLPFNYKGTAINEGAGMKRVSCQIDATLIPRLNGLAADHQLSFKSLCVAAHVYLMHMLCSEQDVITGVVTHDRPELENSEFILGCFLNTIPVRIDFTEVKDMLSLLKKVNGYLTAAKPNEIHLSDIARIVEEKASSGNPFFDTILNYTDFHLYEDLDRQSAIRSLDMKNGADNIEDANQMTNTLFDVEVGKTLNRFSLSIKYAPAYFNEPDVAYALKLYVRILERFVQDVRMPLASVNLLSDEELKETVYDFNDTAIPYAKEQTINALFEAQVVRSPENIALSQDGIEMSYTTLNARANQLAGRLIAAGVKPGDNVGLLVSRSFDMIIGMYGILKAGAAYVPIDPEYPADRQEYIAENSAVTKILMDDDYSLCTKLPNVTFIRIDGDELTAYSTDNPGVAISSSQLAYTIYTSGSTGRPKGVMIEHHSAVNLIEWVNSAYKVGSGDRLLFITSMCFDLSVYDIFGMLAAGGTIVIARQSEVQDVSRLKALLKEERITFWDSVPTTMNYLVNELEVENEGYVQHDLRLVFLSGDWIPVQLPDRIRTYFPSAAVISLGGATEGTVWSNYYPIEKVGSSWSSIPYGRPISNNTFYILDDQLRPVPRGVAGELYIGGVGVARGYANDEAKTAHSFRPDPFISTMGGRMYKTGDLGRFLPDGNMEFIGRKDNQVKIRGYRVELGEIESVLAKHGKVKEAIVNVNRDANNINQLCGYLVLNAPVDIHEIKEYLRTTLPAYMVPNHYIILDCLPLNSNGKINRKALPVPTDKLENSNAADAYVAPATPLEEQLARIWRSILHIERIGVKDDFFDLGANSLSVGAFVNRVHKETGLQVNIPEVFMQPTIEGIADLLNNKNRKGFEWIAPAANWSAYPVSASQQQLWILSRFGEGDQAYHIPGIYLFEGKLNIPSLEASFNSLIERHEILRTVFREIDGEVKQVILSPQQLAFRISYIDLRKAERQDELARKQVEKEFARPFDLAAGPLIRASLIQLENNKWVFVCVKHHIISDGWSTNILVNELVTFYNAYLKGNTNPLKPLRIQYKDYAVWQRDQLSGGAMQGHLEYWREQLAGELPVLELAGDNMRPPVKTFNGGRIDKTIDQSLSASFRALTQEQGGTLFMGLIAMLNVLLHRYTGQKDIIIGTPVAGRDHIDLEDQIGFYVNTLALRTRFNAADSYKELLRIVKDVTLNAYAHQAYPFDELLRELNLQRDVSRGALFDVMAVLQNNGATGGDHQQHMDGVQINKYENTRHVNSKFDLVFDFVETVEGIVARIEYNSDIYNSDTVERLASHLESLIAAVVSAPGTPVCELEYLHAAEKHELLYSFNETSSAYPDDKTITALFEQQVKARPDNTAIVFEDREFSYRQINELANQIGNYLRKVHKVKAEDLVGIKLERDEWLVAAMLGVLKAGAGCVPIDAEYPEERTAYIQSDSNWKVLLDAAELKRFMEVSDRYDAVNPAGINECNHLCYVIYTSGSTGAPKGVMLEHRGVINHLFSKIRLLDLHEGSVVCHNSALHFVGGIWQLLAPLITGGKVVLCNNEELRNIDKLLSVAHRYNSDVLEVIPSQLNEHLSYEQGIDLSGIKTLILTGEKLNAHFVSKCYADNPQLEIINTYGQTEFSDVTCSYRIPRDARRNNVLAGKPIQNTQIYVLSDHGALCPVGVVGEVCTSGDGMSRGYINKPDLTAASYVAHPFQPGSRLYKTGDLGRRLPGGDIEIIGRKDDQVKVRGYRIELSEIEHALLQYKGIDEAVVLPENKGTANAKLVAYVVGKDPLQSTHIRSYLLQRIPGYMVPADYVVLDSMPLLPNGKINKKALPFYAGNTMNTGVQYVAPRNDVESKLAGIWEQILQKEKVGINDNFFELGGHSLKATILLNRIEHAFKVKMTLKEIFQTPFVNKLAESIQIRKWLNESRKSAVTTERSREVIKV